MRTKLLLPTKFVTILLFFVLSSNAFGQQRIGINGRFQGDNAFTVEGFSYFDIGEYQNTKFLITNKTSDDVEVSFEVAITYTCNRVETSTRNIFIKGKQSVTVGTYLKETRDKNCVDKKTDGTKTTIIGVDYLGLVTKNISADKRKQAAENNKRKQEFDGYMANVSKYYNAKNYDKAIEELTKVSQMANLDTEGRLTREWGIKIQESKDKEAYDNQIKSSTTNTGNKTAETKSSSDDFWNDSPPSKSGSGIITTRKETAAEKKIRQDKEVVDKVNQIVADGERQRAENQRKMDIWSNNLNTTFYAQQSAKSAYDNVKQNSNLTGNYSSVEELEREFNQKYNTINQSVNEWKESADESVRQGANLLFNNGTASGQAIGEFAGMVGSLFNNGEKEKKEARERLEKQKQQYLTEFVAKKKAALKDLRTKLIAEFPDGGTPLSKHNITESEVYCFAYYSNQSNIGADNPEIYITNVFPVTQYSDGTWPFKNALINEIKTKTKAPQITLMGYYTQKDLADKMRQSLINLSGKAEMKVIAMEYKGKAVDKNSKSSSGDFWETGKTETKKETSKTKSDDFWNN